MNAKYLCIIFMVFLSSCKQTNAKSDTLWLVIGASSQSLTPIIKEKQRLVRNWPSASIVSTDDCKHARRGFFVLTVIREKSKTKAQQAVAKLKKQVPDAYIKRCVIVNRSRLALGVPLVHPSVERVLDDVINWRDEDRVTELRHLNNTYYLIIQRVYDPKDTSYREGRQQRILLFKDDPTESVLLNDQCWDFGDFSYHNPYVAFHCASMVAGDHFIHTSEIYHLQPPRKLSEKIYCRNPVIHGDRQWTCQEETVDAEGKLSFTPIEQMLPTKE